MRIRRSDLDRFLEEGSTKPSGGERFGVLVGPFESKEAAEAWRREHAIEAATDAQAEIVPFTRA